LGSVTALTGALLHVVAHAVAKGCLFGTVGSLSRKTPSAEITGFAGAAQRAPVTMAAFSIAALSLVGVPPMAGFFSKWYLLRGALDANAPSFAAVILVSSLLSAVYFFRVLEQIYFVSDPGVGEKSFRSEHERSWAALGPLVALGTAVLLIGIFNGHLVTEVIRHALPVL